MTDDVYQAAEEAFGSFPKPEPYIGMRIRMGNKYVTYHKGHDLVYQAIKKVPGAKDDDGLLLAVVWEDKWDYSKSLRENIVYLPRSENLTRRRRDLHLMGLVEYSPKAMKSRTEAFKNEREKASPISPQIKRFFSDARKLAQASKVNPPQLNRELKDNLEQMRLV